MTLMVFVIFGYFFYLLRYAFNTGMNPLSIPLLFWLFACFLSSLNLMVIDSVSFTGFLIVFGGLFFIVLSAILFRKFSFSRSDNSSYLDKYNKAILLIASCSILINFAYVLRTTGGITNFVLDAAELYHDRIDGLLKTPIPYLPSMIFISCVYFGGKVATNRSLTNYLFVFMALAMSLLDSLLSFGRANFLIGFLLVFFSFLFRRYEVNKFRFNLSLKFILLVLIPISALLFLLVLVRDVRGGTENMRFKGEVPNIVVQMEEWGLFRPSLYFYFVSPLAVFDNSLDYTFTNNMPMGYETFSPVYRPLLKIFNYDKITYYEEFVQIGEKSSNVGTMYKDPLVDFGYWGLIPFSIFLGLLVQLSYQKWLNFSNLYLISFVSTYLFMGVIMNLFRLGQFFIPFLVIVFVTYLPTIRIKIR